ncbi:4 glycosyl hydrolase family protein, partial [Vibrio parahaemolyticus V-223/04]
KSASLAT